MDGELDSVHVIDAFVGIGYGRCKSQQGKRQQSRTQVAAIQFQQISTIFMIQMTAIVQEISIMPLINQIIMPRIM